MKRLGRWSLAVTLLAAVLVAAGPAEARGPLAIKVMTRNQYVGADFTPVILAQTEQEFLDAATAVLTQAASNNFPRRAKGLAREVFLTRPDVIGLQEVFDLTVNGEHIGPPFVDHLTVTLDALAAVGLHYVVAGTVTHLDVTLPIDLVGDDAPELVQVRDRDVILVKKGLAFTSLRGLHNAGGLCGVPIPNPVPVPPFPATLQSTPSQDGCTYTIVAGVNSPVGPITVKRGFLGVDVKVAGKTYRVVNTHLEIKQPDPTNPASAIIQSLQSIELAGTLEATTPPGLTLIALGDFNSSPLDLGPIVPPYQVLVGAGFADAWDQNALAPLDPDGFTCCQDAALANTSSVLSERIDLIFVQDVGSFQALALVTGRLPLFPFSAAPHWASDHGGLFGTLIFLR